MIYKPFKQSRQVEWQSKIRMAEQIQENNFVVQMSRSV